MTCFFPDSGFVKKFNVKEASAANVLATKPETPTGKPWFKKKRFVIPLALIVLAGIGSITGGSDKSKNSSSASSNSTKRNYPVSYVRSAAVNPATLSVVFNVTNDGTEPISPSCTIRMQDSSGTYKGYDFFDITNPISAGQTKQIVVNLTITKEGAQYADQFSGECTATTTDTGSSAGQAVVISDIKNCSDHDEDGWYWGACFKSDQAPMTQMDCTVKGLDSNGKEVGTHSFRANTVNDGKVVSYGQDVLWYVMAKQTTVQSIKSFDVNCTL